MHLRCCIQRSLTSWDDVQPFSSERRVCTREKNHLRKTCLHMALRESERSRFAAISHKTVPRVYVIEILTQFLKSRKYFSVESGVYYGKRIWLATKTK